jgi:hypothetical protein
VTPTSDEHERPRCKGCLRPTRLGTSHTARPVVLHPYRRLTPGGCSRDFEEILGLARESPARRGSSGCRSQGLEPRERAGRTPRSRDFPEPDRGVVVTDREGFPVRGERDVADVRPVRPRRSGSLTGAQVEELDNPPVASRRAGLVQPQALTRIHP